MRKIELTGSEKQVAWADKIRAVFESNVEVVRSIAEADAAEYWPAQAEQITAMVARLIDHIQSSESAKAWIDARDIVGSHDAGQIADRLITEARRKIGGDNRLFLAVLADFEH